MEKIGYTSLIKTMNAENPREADTDDNIKEIPKIMAKATKTSKIKKSIIFRK